MALILIIDDDIAIRHVLECGLSGFGHTVLTAADGLTGLQLAAGQPVDLILLDVDMPQMSGLAVCQALKRHPDFRRLPVLMMTGRRTWETVLRAQQAGALAVLGKPFSWDELLGQLAHHLPNQSGPAIPPAVSGGC